MSDALRAANLPMYGYPRDTAPNLRELASEGIVFANHFAHYPGTSVSVSQFHSGRLMSPLLMSYKYIAVPVRAIPSDLLILPRAFGEQGYRTGMITSHYWLRSESRLRDYYEEKITIPAPGSYAPFEELWPPVERFLDEADADGRPFFLYVHSMDTHGPNSYRSGFDRFRGATDMPEDYNVYDGEILYTDFWVGRIVEHLRRRGLLDDTIFVFTADHGDEFNEMGPERWNRNHGPQVRRALMHVPLIVRLPDGASGGRRFEGVTRHVDVAPTLLRLAVPGFDLTPYRVDGEDLSTEIRDGAAPPPGDRLAFAFSPRTWGVFQADAELYYDHWNQTFSPLLRPVPDEHNYPRPEPRDAPELRKRLEGVLHAEYERRTKEFEELPERADLPTLSKLALLLPVMRMDPPAPTFEDGPADDRWGLPITYLEAHPGEHPPRVRFSTPWVHGTYRVFIRLYEPRVREGWENRFSVRIGDGAPVELAGEQAREALLDAGIHEIGGVLEVEIDRPSGGVAIAALELERVGGPRPSAARDEDLREHLRSLGYVD